jgi:hypothetical protein
MEKSRATAGHVNGAMPIWVVGIITIAMFI